MDLKNRNYRWEKDIVIFPNTWTHIPEVGVDVIQSTEQNQIVTAFKSQVDNEFRVMHSGYTLGIRLHKHGS